MREAQIVSLDATNQKLNSGEGYGSKDHPQSQLAGGELLDPTPFNSMSKIRLNDAETIRMEMARVYRDMRMGRIDTQDGTRLAYVLDMVRKAHETCELQRRVEVIDQVNKMRKVKK